MSTNGTQESLSPEVIRQTIADTEAFLAAADRNQRQAAYHEAWEYIEGLYTEFAPQASQRVRSLGTLIGANALTFVGLRYGFNDTHPGLYGGDVEQDVIATYHHAGHTRGVIRDMFRYAAVVNQQDPETYTEDSLLRIPVVGGFHDAIIGSGRGVDERLSAALAVYFMDGIGAALLTDPETSVGICASIWNPVLQRQSVNPGLGYLPMQRAMAVGDMMPLFDERGPYEGVAHGIEELSKVMYDRIYTMEARAAGFRLAGRSVDECVEFIDSREALRRAYGNYLGRQVNLFRTFQPADPRLDEMFTGRPLNVQRMEDLHQNYMAGKLNAIGTLAVSRNYLLG